MADPRNRVIEDALCKKLAQMRLDMGMQQKDLAFHVGVSRVAIWNWENCITFPQALANLRKWAEAVDAELEIKLTVKNDDEFIF